MVECPCRVLCTLVRKQAGQRHTGKDELAICAYMNEAGTPFEAKLNFTYVDNPRRHPYFSAF
jgi:hypothetical protein